MPRFVAKPVVIEAWQFTGSIAFWPESFRLAVGRHLPGGLTEIMTGDGMRPVPAGAWIAHGPDGTFSVWRDAAFETMFAPHETIPLADPDPSAKRPKKP